MAIGIIGLLACSTLVRAQGDYEGPSGIWMTWNFSNYPTEATEMSTVYLNVDQLQIDFQSLATSAVVEAVPEPTSLGLAVLAVGLASARRLTRKTHIPRQ